jgi:bacteriocin-like protein
MKVDNENELSEQELKEVVGGVVIATIAPRKAQPDYASRVTNTRLNPVPVLNPRINPVATAACW